jgi:cell shape-determining protein MreC
LPLEGARLVPAQVIRASTGGSQSGFIINRGISDGIAKGQTICDVGGREAHVRLFTHPASRIEVVIARLDIDRVMAGNAGNSAKIPMVPVEHKIKVGDNVFARSKPGLLDAPIIIGRVAECKKDDQKPLLWDITIKPACDIERLENVAVIIMNP